MISKSNLCHSSYFAPCHAECFPIFVVMVCIILTHFGASLQAFLQLHKHKDKKGKELLQFESPQFVAWSPNSGLFVVSDRAHSIIKVVYFIPSLLLPVLVNKRFYPFI